MRIERVVARAFGPFRDEQLEFAPGMTVVAGPNEAGKSTWHAALRLALTGLRRGKGPGTLAERGLAERHRPWDQTDRWEVEARLQLADGRRIEINQDLAGKVDCRAVDVDLGRDVSNEILDGTPDASRWLGLNRDTFASTVSVSQAQILAVTEAADELQEQMQRAAATQGTDSTAAGAIDRLEQFRRDAVGVDRVGARGPLRTAKDRLGAAEVHLANARQQHEGFLERSAEVEAADRRVEEARDQVLRAEAQLAAGRAAAARARHHAAAELASRHPVPPEAVGLRDERADAVAAAIDGWASKPGLVAVSGPAAERLEQELAALPAEPDGDLEPHESVRDAFRALDQAEAAIAAIGDEPAVGDQPLPDLEEGRVRELARRLRTPQLPGAAGLQQELAAARVAARASHSAWVLPAAAAAVLAAVAGIVLLLLGQAPVGAALLMASAVGVGMAWRGGANPRRSAARLARAEAALAPYEAARAAAEGDRAAAESEARAAGLPVDPRVLDDLADQLAAALAARRLAAERAARLATLVGRRDAARHSASAALQQRGEPLSADLAAAFDAYRLACRRRAEQAAGAARREPLRRQIEAQRALEQSAAAAADASAAAEQRLRAAATAVEVDGSGPPDQVVRRLRGWQQERAERMRAQEAAAAEWQRLQALLDGRSLEDVEAAAERAEREAAALAERSGPVGVPAAEELARVESRLVGLREALMTASREADALHGSLAARRETLPDVADAEEAAAAAQGELDRVIALAATLDRTLGLLRSAQERVHRSLAPVLAAAIGRWLPAISGGAYAEVSVDPADLSVRVKEEATGKWREARLLSEGTREQIYLLLRVAMAEHLVTAGETAPLLLDEVTVQSDTQRKRQLLAVLHGLSAERQVILFTHDDDVVDWAEQHLAGEGDAIVRLEPRVPSAPIADRRAIPVEEATPVAVGD